MTDSPENVLKALAFLSECRRCACPDCTRSGSGEPHDHVCTNAAGCVETRHRSRVWRREASRTALRASRVIRDLMGLAADKA